MYRSVPLSAIHFGVTAEAMEGVLKATNMANRAMAPVVGLHTMRVHRIVMVMVKQDIISGMALEVDRAVEAVVGDRTANVAIMEVAGVVGVARAVMVVVGVTRMLMAICITSGIKASSCTSLKSKGLA